MSELFLSLFQFYLFAHLLSCTRAMYTTLLMKESACSRWWARHVALLRVLGMQVATDHSSRHHRHPTSRNTWLPKLSYCANSSKGNSSEVDDHQPQSVTYPDFFGTQPPLFNRTEEPLDADAWIKTIESKFYLLTVPCSEANKACFAAQ